MCRARPLHSRLPACTSISSSFSVALGGSRRAWAQCDEPQCGSDLENAACVLVFSLTLIISLNRLQLIYFEQS